MRLTQNAAQQAPPSGGACSAFCRSSGSRRTPAANGGLNLHLADLRQIRLRAGFVLATQVCYSRYISAEDRPPRRKDIMPHIITPLVPLPRTEDGHVDTSARFGEIILVKVTYNTAPDGAPVDDDDDSNFTLHGPFHDTDEAVEWMNDHAPDDTDIREVETIVANAVR